MKKLFVILIVSVVFVLSSCIENDVYIDIEQTQVQVVYITTSDNQYHNDSCQYVAGDKIEVSLYYAQINGYVPCEYCYNDLLQTYTYSTQKNERKEVIQYGDNTDNILNINDSTTIFITKDGHWNKYVRLPNSGQDGYKLKIISKSSFSFYILKDYTNLETYLPVSTGTEINFERLDNIWIKK